jgi:hypothetical protein
VEKQEESILDRAGKFPAVKMGGFPFAALFGCFAIGGLTLWGVASFAANLLYIYSFIKGGAR